MLTIDKEKMYIRKLDELGKRYDALRDRCMKLELGETPPKRLAVLLGVCLFHVDSAIGYYKQRKDEADLPEIARRANEGNLAKARECREFLLWLVEVMKK